MSEITLRFPDGAERRYPQGITGKELAEGISKSLAKKAVAIARDGELADLADPINADSEIKIITRTDPEALELIRHDAAHVMAEAVQELWPGTQVTIGPVSIMRRSGTPSASGGRFGKCSVVRTRS